MNFVFEEHTGSNNVMVCENEKETDEFSRLLSLYHKRWSGGQSYLSKRYSTTGLAPGGCAFLFNQGCYIPNVEDFDGRYNLLFWKDFTRDYSKLEVSFDDIVALIGR